MSSSSRKSKGEDKNALAMREVQNSCPENKKCFECDQRGPTYVNMTVGSFVCTKCSGMLRGINPPHRIKSISMSSFTSEEVSLVRQRGNAYCAKVWLGHYDNPRGEFKDDEAIKEFIIEKYEKKRYYVDPSTINHVVASPTSSAPSEPKQPLSSLIGSTIRASATHSSTTAFSRPMPSRAQPQTVAMPPQPAVQASRPPPPQPSHGLAVAPPPPNADPFASSGPAGASESFANFDQANFDSKPVDPLHSAFGGIPVNVSSQPVNQRTFVDGGRPQQQPKQKPQQQQQQQKPMEDRYAALKDLDDIFRTCTVSTAPEPAKPTTGSNLFGSSAAPAPAPAASQPSVFDAFGSTSSAFSSPSSAFTGGSSSSSSSGGVATNGGGRSVSPQWAETKDGWGAKDTNGGWAGSAKDTNGGWATAWPQQNTAPSQGRQSAPINPFTGATNLNQLNTSPWPITSGSSPIQSSNNTTSGSTGFANFPDPFASSTTSNNMSSDMSNDLFAKAPKPGGINVDNGFIRDFFNVDRSTGNAPSQSVTNPWATGNTGTFTGNMVPASNPNNPFL